MKLKIKLIPQTMYGKNLRSVLSETKWRQISRLVRNNSNCICEICEKRLNNISEMEAHEDWEYVIIKKKNGKKLRIQRLRKILAICKDCHRAVHIGRTSFGKHYDKTVDHFMKVNKCSYSKFKEKERKAYEKFAKRSQYKWKLDINKDYLKTLLNEDIN